VPPISKLCQREKINFHMPHGLGRKKTHNVDLGEKGSFKVHKGALHEALGVPQGEKIPASKLKGHHHGRLGRMIASARGFAAMKH
jgi:hypothetical protein